MGRKFVFFLISFVLILCVGVPSTGFAEDIPLQDTTIPGSTLPENTVFLATSQDARFSQDFSTLLKHARLSWIILDNPTVPDHVKDQNLLLLGNLNSPISGELIQDILTTDEIELLRTDPGLEGVLEIESPWQEDRTVIICSGGDSSGIRDAAESALRSLIANAPPISDWIKSAYEAPRDHKLQATLDQLQYDWEDEELTVQALTMDIAAKTSTTISAEKAAEDVERLFYLFSHGYSGYGFFNQEGQFDQAKTNILQELSNQSIWSSSALSDVLHGHLQFISDCHLTIGEHRFSNHVDFWYDTKYELSLAKDDYQLILQGTSYIVVSVNGGDPGPFIFPSLNQDGDPIYRLGTLSSEKPRSLQVVVRNGEGQRSVTVKLKKSSFEYYAEEIFREDILGGIPVIRARSFGDYYRETLSEFPKTAAKYRDTPVAIVDIRGNGGGNESWPISWIQYLTGQRAESIFVFSELESKTSLMGRANAFDYWIQTADIGTYRSDYLKHTRLAESIESGTREAGWRGPIYPPLPLIPIDTTVVVVTNDQVASAGEGFVLRASQLENVLVVGENTMGCLTFGNISAHKLPHSNLTVWMPINFGLFPDQEIREGVGLAPDLWVPAADAVNYAVAALRKGTISTELPLSPEILQADFNPESFWNRTLQNALEYWSVILLCGAASAVWSYFFRKNGRILLIVGGVWCLFALYWLLTSSGKAIHFGLLTSGLISLAWGLVNLFTSIKNSRKVKNSGRPGTGSQA